MSMQMCIMKEFIDFMALNLNLIIVYDIYTV